MHFVILGTSQDVFCRNIGDIKNHGGFGIFCADKEGTQPFGMLETRSREQDNIN